MFPAGHSITKISLTLTLSNKTISAYKQCLLEKPRVKCDVEAVDIARLHELHQCIKLFRHFSGSKKTLRGYFETFRKGVSGTQV